MIDQRRPSSSSDDFELHRTPLMRAVGGPLFQGFLLLLTVLGLGTVPFSTQPLANLSAGVVTLLLWLPALFGFVRVDDIGIHRRCYRTTTDRWEDITKIELHVQHFGLQGFRPVIRVHRTRHRHMLTPACGMNRAADEFALRLLAAASGRGIAVDAQAWEPGLSRRAAEL